MSYWCMCIIILNIFIFQSSVNSEITIINYENQNDGMGNSNYRYTLSDGSTREESVTIVHKGMEDEYPVIKGIYSYITNEVEYRVHYVADINGFRQQLETVPLLTKNNVLSSTIAPMTAGAVGSLIVTLQGGGLG